MKLVITLIICAILVACAPRHKPDAIPFPPANCENTYVLLPGNFVIDLAAESEIILDPATHEFIIYCTPQDASHALDNAIKDKQIQDAKDWKIYVLNERIDEIGIPCHEDNLCLQRPATVKDWVNLDESPDND